MRDRALVFLGIPEDLRGNLLAAVASSTAAAAESTAAAATAACSRRASMPLPLIVERCPFLLLLSPPPLALVLRPAARREGLAS